MNLQVKEISDADEFEFSASYGTTVVLLRSRRAGTFRDPVALRLGQVREQDDHYAQKHPQAA